MTNFANWYAYYSTRMQLMKTGVGYAFTQVDGRYRVGLVTINPGSPVASSKYLRIDGFEGTHRADWYDKLYSQTPERLYAAAAKPFRASVATSRAGPTRSTPG